MLALTVTIIYSINVLPQIRNINVKNLQTRRPKLKPAQLVCIFDADRAFQKLNVSWFITFGSALFYHRNKSFDTSDIDTGLFYNDAVPVSNRLVTAFTAQGFKLKTNYGSINDGQEWQFRCPISNIQFDVFVFYPPLPADPKPSTFLWWTSSYHGKCDKMRYKKCRFKFSSITPEEVIIQNRSFLMSPRSFLVEQYGADWTTPKSYSYYQLLDIATNIIPE